MPLVFTKPQHGAAFTVGEAVEFEGTTDPGTTRVELIADDQFTFPPTTISGDRWFVANRLNQSGARRITATAFDAADAPVGTADLTVSVRLPDFASLVRIPDDINRGVTKATQETMLRVFGPPGQLSADCTNPTSAKVRGLLVTESVGPFRVTGIRPAVEAVRRAFANAAREVPELLPQLTSAGMTCVRRIRTLPGRPPSRQFSNHSWGTALDIKVRNTLDPRGDGRTQLGLLVLSPFFNEERFFWGAGFGGAFEDAMHFEASDELVRQWDADGIV